MTTTKPNPNITPDDLSIAEKILLDAAGEVRRASIEHGHTYRSFTMIAESWSIYMKHAFTIRGDSTLKAHDVAHMMSLVKQARAVYGYSVDNFVDGVGYTALAAMLTPPVGNNKPENTDRPETLSGKAAPITPLVKPEIKTT